MNYADSRLDHVTLDKFALMRFNALVQLRDCLTDLLDPNDLTHSVAQATYLLETLRRSIVDESTKTDLQGAVHVNGR